MSLFRFRAVVTRNGNGYPAMVYVELELGFQNGNDVAGDLLWGPTGAG